MVALLVIIIIVIFVVIVSAAKHSTSKIQQPEQPTHFDLLDDNGDPITAPTVKELQYFCTKDSGYYVSVWPKDQNTGDYIEFNIAGMSHRDNIEDYLGEHAGRLEAEPSNPYDHNAIKIISGDGHHVGYVPKDMTSEVRKHAKLPCKCFFYIGENDDTYFSDCYIKLQIWQK